MKRFFTTIIAIRNQEIFYQWLRYNFSYRFNKGVIKLSYRFRRITDEQYENLILQANFEQSYFIR